MLLITCIVLQSIYQPKNALNKIQFMTSFTILMFRYRCAIVRESSRTKEYKYNTLF